MVNFLMYCRDLMAFDFYIVLYIVLMAMSTSNLIKNVLIYGHVTRIKVDFV